MEMSRVMKCEVSDCAYNRQNCCQTMAITIGDGFRPRCDTFCRFTEKGGETGCTAGVGACKVFSCVYNRDLECRAPGISVGYKGQEPDCMTFQPK